MTNVDFIGLIAFVYCAGGTLGGMARADSEPCSSMDILAACLLWPVSLLSFLIAFTIFFSYQLTRAMLRRLWSDLKYLIHLGR